MTFDVTKKNFGIENNSFMFGHDMQMLAYSTSCGAWTTNNGTVKKQEFARASIVEE